MNDYGVCTLGKFTYSIFPDQAECFRSLGGIQVLKQMRVVQNLIALIRCVLSENKYTHSEIKWIKIK